THPAKTAAGAMLGTAVLQATSGKKPEFQEEHLEWLGDDALLDRLAQSKRAACKKIAERILFRGPFRAAFRAPILEFDHLHHDEYRMKEEKLQKVELKAQKVNLFDPAGRVAAEQELA